MKKFTLFVVLLVSSVSFAQLKKVDVVKAEPIGKVGGALGTPKSIECTKTGNTYTFEYRDMKLTSIEAYKEFSFDDVDNTFEDLYKTIIDGFENTPKEDVVLSLPNYIITLDYTKALGIVNLNMYITLKNTDVTGLTAALSKKQVDKLFGKKK
ncbi:hypothetical protein [Flavobacterium psychrotrophum]|uniref:hypothetical protein n=1 Tax=Flavobacterium psychrotrophum TaxID=2294119 RepID=UPI000E31041E|nr:hypothetical protein [Flavobacterium psychrotrophum]